MMSLVQIVLLTVSGAGIFLSLVRYRRGLASLAGLLGWGLLWTVMGVSVLAPTVTTAIANIIGVGRGADAAIYLAVTALFYLLFRAYAQVDDLRTEITRLVRDEALRDLRLRQAEGAQNDQ